MSPQKPKWWRLYAVFLLMLALLVAEHQLSLAAGSHQAVQIGIVLVTYGLVHFWLRANAAALMRAEQEQGQWTIVVTEYPPAEGARDNRRPVFQLPEPAPRDTLGDTFELESADRAPIDISLN